jgi:hypothetical protein
MVDLGTAGEPSARTRVWSMQASLAQAPTNRSVAALGVAEAGDLPISRCPFEKALNGYVTFTSERRSRPCALTAGCGVPEDIHGDDRNIVWSQVDSADAVGISPQQAAQNIQDMAEQQASN